MEQLELLYIADKNTVDTVTLLEMLAVSYKVKHKFIISSFNPTLRYLSKRNENSCLPKTCVQIFTILLIIAKAWKQPKCPSAGEQIHPHNGIVLSNKE